MQRDEVEDGSLGAMVEVEEMEGEVEEEMAVEATVVAVEKFLAQGVEDGEWVGGGVMHRKECTIDMEGVVGLPEIHVADMRIFMAGMIEMVEIGMRRMDVKDILMMQRKDEVVSGNLMTGREAAVTAVATAGAQAGVGGGVTAGAEERVTAGAQGEATAGAGAAVQTMIGIMSNCLVTGEVCLMIQGETHLWILHQQRGMVFLQRMVPHQGHRYL